MNLKELAQMIEISAVRTDSTLEEVDQMIDAVLEYGCICAAPMPWLDSYTIEKLELFPEIRVLGPVGFPSGASTTANKVREARELIDLGCTEIDMVTNVSALLSGNLDYFYKDVKAVVDECFDVPVKAILEICYLTDEQIRTAADLCAKAGVTFVKSGTGWGPKPTTVETIKIMKEAVGDRCQVKAAGGVRDLDTMLEMIDAGCTRFGLGVRTAISILEEAKERMK